MRAEHQVFQHCGVVAPARQQRPDLLVQMVVRRREPDALQIRVLLHGEMPERRALVHAHPGVVRQRTEIRVVKQHRNEVVRHLALNGAGAVRKDALFLQRHVPILICHHVAAVAGVAGFEHDAGGRSLQRRAAEEVFARRAAEDRHDGRVAAGGVPVRYVFHAAEHAVRSKLVDRSLVGNLQRRLSAELLHGVVGHAVADDEQIFHKPEPLFHLYAFSVVYTISSRL